MKKLIGVMLASLLLSLGMQTASAQDNSMSFFVTSEGSGNGGDLGGLDGADAHCQALAEAAGEGNREWRAYLGTEAEGGRGVSARSRIGNGPWYNADGVMVASDVDNLHINPNLSGATAVATPRGMPRTVRAAAARNLCRRLAATACSTASRRTERQP